MRAKPLALPCHVLHVAPIQAVVIQACLTNGDDFWQRRALKQISQRRLDDALIVRMDTDGRPEIGMRQSHPVHLGEFLQRRANAQRAIHALCRHRGANLGHTAGELGEGQVAVGINEHGKTPGLCKPRTR